VTEESDALAVVVSEETGQMSVAHSGRLIRNLDQDRLRRVLRTLMKLDTRTDPRPPTTPRRFPLNLLFGKESKSSSQSSLDRLKASERRERAQTN
jgi:hypothetical protein